jgi:hypothetical protein
MGALTDALTAVGTVLTAAGVTTQFKEYSTTTPPTAAHAVLTVEGSPLDRIDVDNFDGTITVTVDWFTPGNASDGQTQYLTAIDAFDTLVVALIAGLDRTCQQVDPNGNIERLEESADLAHWYTGTITCVFMRKEPATV